MLFVASFSANAASLSLDEIRTRGYIKCGVNPHGGGFANRDAKGDWHGFDVDLCRAIAVAIFDRADRVRFVPVDTQTRLEDLSEGRIDILSRNTTWTLRRELDYGIVFPAITYYDGMGLMVRRNLKILSVDDLNGLSVCVQKGTTSIAKLKEFFLINVIDWEAVEVMDIAEARTAYEADKCQVIAADQSMLHAVQPQLSHPDRSRILDDVISKEPLGPAVRDDDKRWIRIVRWTVHALINAEELNLSKDNINLLSGTNASPAALALLATGDEDWERRLYLRKGWVKQVIRKIGNYGDIFDLNLGDRSPIGMQRGLNALWNQGGLLYAPPVE